MSRQREILMVWDDENYPNVEEAQKDGAITRICVPSHLNSKGQTAFIEGIVEGLKAAGDRISGYPQKLQFKTITETLQSVPVEILEWNTYHFDVWSSSIEEAQQVAVDKGISLKHNDVEYGTSNYFSEESSSDRLVNN